EAATRRLAIALSRGLALPPSPSRPGPAKAGSQAETAGSRTARGATGSAHAGGSATPGPLRPVPLPLLDRLPSPFMHRPRCVPAHLAPRISLPGFFDPQPLPAPPSAHDLLDATRLRLRLQGLTAAL